MADPEQKEPSKGGCRLRWGTLQMDCFLSTERNGEKWFKVEGFNRALLAWSHTTYFTLQLNLFISNHFLILMLE